MKTNFFIVLMLIISTIQSQSNDFDKIKNQFLQMKQFPVLSSDKAVLLCMAELQNEPILAERKAQSDFDANTFKMQTVSKIENKKNRIHTTPTLLK